MAAEPIMRTVRTRGERATTPRSAGASDRGLGGLPAARTTSCMRVALLTRIGSPLSVASPPTVALKSSSRKGS
eukprot:6213025-Pleurochrysis_carterae.AAC.3